MLAMVCCLCMMACSYSLADSLPSDLGAASGFELWVSTGIGSPSYFTLICDSLTFFSVTGMLDDVEFYIFCISCYF